MLAAHSDGSFPISTRGYIVAGDAWLPLAATVSLITALASDSALPISLATLLSTDDALPLLARVNIIGAKIVDDVLLISITLDDAISTSAASDDDLLVSEVGGVVIVPGITDDGITVVSSVDDEELQ
jgi:hypothetical protein